MAVDVQVVLVRVVVVGGINGVVLQPGVFVVIKHKVQHHDMAFKGKAVDSKASITCRVLASSLLFFFSFFFFYNRMCPINTIRDRLRGNRRLLWRERVSHACWDTEFRSTYGLNACSRSGFVADTRSVLAYTSHCRRPAYRV